MQDHAAFPPEECSTKNGKTTGRTDGPSGIRIRRDPQAAGPDADPQSELAVFSGMWSEHCSYKSTKHLLSTLPKDSPHVLAGPGGARWRGIGGEGWAVAFKIESHNHPSAVEPYQGAATGVGGILRCDCARRATLCAARFCALAVRIQQTQKRIASGVVSGIGGYGNAIGVPIVGVGLTLIQPMKGIRWSMRWRWDLSAHTSYVMRAPKESEMCSCSSEQPPDGMAYWVPRLRAKRWANRAALRSGDRTSRYWGDPFSGKRLLEAILAFGPAQGLLAVQDLGDVELPAQALRWPRPAESELTYSSTTYRCANLI